MQPQLKPLELIAAWLDEQQDLLNKLNLKYAWSRNDILILGTKWGSTSTYVRLSNDEELIIQCMFISAHGPRYNYNFTSDLYNSNFFEWLEDVLNKIGRLGEYE